MPIESLKIPSAQGTLDCTVHLPTGTGPWPGAVMFTDIFGPRPAFHAMADRLAGNGYAVLLPNVYYRHGPAPVPDLTTPPGDPVRMRPLYDLMATLTPQRLRADGVTEIQALRQLRHVAPGPIGVVGYCMGGLCAIYTAQSAAADVRAVACYHTAYLIRDDPDSPHRIAPQLDASLYFGHAANDDSIPQQRLSELECALAGSSVDFTSEIYTGSGHGFAVIGNRRFNEAGAERHWQTLLNLFNRKLKANR